MKRAFRTKRAARIYVLVLVGSLGGPAAHAETWRVVPSISLIETLTDNVALAPTGQRQSDLVTQLTPGIRVDGTGARLKLFFDYRMNNILYANSSSSNRTQNYLSAFGTLEAVENWLFIDASARITQQPISAFGAQPTAEGDVNVNSNRAETSAYQLSPYIRGRLGSVAQYELRNRLTTTSARRSGIADTEMIEWIGNVKSSSPERATISWAVDLSRQDIDRPGTRDLESSRLRGLGSYLADPEVRLSVSAGRESNNYLSGTTQNTTTYGAGVEWTPTPRTTVSAFRERRFFGDAHNFTVRHRTPRTAWQFSDVKDARALPTELATVRAGTAYDLLFDALASRFPDPLLRAQEVERQLQQSGTPADLVLTSTFLSPRVTVVRSRQAAVTMLGVRNTVTLAATIADQQRIGLDPGLADDFARSSAIETRAISASWGHTLSPLSSINLLVSRRQSIGTATSGLESTETRARLVFSHRVSPRTFATIGARLRRFEGSGASDFHEKALTASLTVTF